jgi:hypothetical protein
MSPEWIPVIAILAVLVLLALAGVIVPALRDARGRVPHRSDAPLTRRRLGRRS